jgi:hypothetical protein
MQKSLCRLCNKDPLEFWRFTPAETSLMIECALDKLKYDDIRRAELLVCISNAPHFRRKDEKPHTLTDFYKDVKKEEYEQTAEEIEAMFFKSFQ